MPIHLKIALPVVFFTLSAQLGLAATIRLQPAEIGLPVYDSNNDGFGLVVSGFDLGLLDPKLSGISLDVTTTNTSGAGRIRVRDFDSGNWDPLQNGVSITYTFSSPIDFAWAADPNDPLDPAGVTRTFQPGEIDSFLGTSGMLTPINPIPFNPNLTIGTASIHNQTSSNILQNFIYLAPNATSVTWTHDDSMGAFNQQALIPWIIPEPSQLVLSALGLATILLRRQRTRDQERSATLGIQE